MLFAVQDHGVGIIPEDQSKLFRPFSQLRPGDLQQGRGSGLGLCICKHIVEMHGGHIGVDSRMGEGSCFFFQVPLQVAEGPAGDAIVDAKHAHQVVLARPQDQPRTALIVDGAYPPPTSPAPPSSSTCDGTE